METRPQSNRRLHYGCILEVSGNIGSAAVEKKPIINDEERRVIEFSIAYQPPAPKGKPPADPIWYKVQIWDKKLHYHAPHLIKGANIFVRGSFKPTLFTRKTDGTKAMSLLISAHQILFHEPPTSTVIQHRKR